MVSKLEQIKKFYETPVQNGKTRLEIWDKEQCINNSMTPSVAYPEYRAKLVAQLDKLLEHSYEKKILSLGAGNAFIENELSVHYKNILVTDVCESALQLARNKGLIARLLDVSKNFALEFKTEKVDLLFSEGLVGHVFDEQLSVKEFLRNGREILAERGIIFIGNEVPTNGHELQLLARANYYFTSAQFLEQALLDAGFTNIHSLLVPYERPGEGTQHRVWAWGTKN